MRFLMVLVLGVMMTAAAAAQENALDMFAPVLGTWVGDSTDPATPDNRDTMRFEMILGGAAVQHTHSINGGLYGGRTIYFFDSSINDGEGGVIYHYFTTAGFHTQGVAWWEDGRLVAEEEVVGHPEITRVRGYVTPTEDGLSSSADYLSNGEWVEGHGFNYSPAPDAEVVFGGE